MLSDCYQYVYFRYLGWCLFNYQCKKCVKGNKTDLDRFGGDKEKAKKYYSEKYQRNKEKVAIKVKKYSKKNREKITKRDGELRQRKKELLPIFAMKLRVSDLIRKAFKSAGLVKNSKTKSIIGCDYETLVKHIESQFKDGMNWENRSKWHIDHIIPLAIAKNEKDIIRLNHYTNLQPLWAIDNLKKGAKI